MYTYQDRMKAVNLYIKYDLSPSDTVRELGYPTRRMLVKWYKEYQETNDLHKQYIKKPRHTSSQMKMAVSYYLEHGRNITRTIRMIGYPSSRQTLRKWIDEIAPNKRKISIRQGSSMIQFSKEQKKDAVIELCAREGSASTIAEKVGTSRTSLYKWKNKLVSEEDVKSMKKTVKPLHSDDRDSLLAEVESLNKDIYRKQMELDILNNATEIIKKDQGINLRKLKNKEKTNLIDAQEENIH